MANPLKLLKLKPYGFQFIKEIEIKASPEKVWDSVVDVEKWFRFDPDPAKASKQTLEPVAGGKWLSKNWEGNLIMLGTVTYVEPGKLIRIIGQLGTTHVPITTVLIFEVQPKSKGKSTMFRLGQRSIGLLEPEMKKRYSKVWKKMLPQLKELAEK